MYPGKRFKVQCQRTSRRIYIPLCLLGIPVVISQYRTAIVKESSIGMFMTTLLAVVLILAIVYHWRAQLILTEKYIETRGLVTRRVHWSDIHLLSQHRGNLTLHGSSRRISIPYELFHWAPIFEPAVSKLNSIPRLRLQLDPAAWGLLARDDEGRLVRS